MAGDVIDARDDDWIVVLGPGPIDATRAQLAAWRDDHPGVPDQDIRIDLIRTEDADELRVLVRSRAS